MDNPNHDYRFIPTEMNTLFRQLPPDRLSAIKGEDYELVEGERQLEKLYGHYELDEIDRERYEEMYRRELTLVDLASEHGLPPAEHVKLFTFVLFIRGMSRKAPLNADIRNDLEGFIRDLWLRAMTYDVVFSKHTKDETWRPEGFDSPSLPYVSVPDIVGDELDSAIRQLANVDPKPFRGRLELSGRMSKKTDDGLWVSAAFLMCADFFYCHEQRCDSDTKRKIDNRFKKWLREFWEILLDSHYWSVNDYQDKKQEYKGNFEAFWPEYFGDKLNNIARSARKGLKGGTIFTNVDAERFSDWAYTQLKIHRVWQVKDTNSP